MKIMKKLLAVFTACMILASMFSGCSSSKDEDVDVNKGGSSSKKASISVLVVTSSLTKDVNELEFLKKVAEDAGVSVALEQVTDATWSDKKSVMLAGGEIPDVILGTGSIYNSDFASFPGMFEDMTELINENAPNIKKMFEEKPETKLMATSLDGKIYGIPKYQRFWPNVADHQLINKTWLDNLNLDMPTTWDELYDVLYAFKTQDPNGNGIADEVPMDWAPGMGSFNAISLLGSYGITANYLSGDGYYVDGGVVNNYYLNEHFKDLCVFFNKLWNDGLINSEVFTQDYSKFQALSRGDGGDTAIVGYTFGFDALDRVGAILADQYVALSPMKPYADYTGPISCDYEHDEINYMQNAAVMSASCKNKVDAMKFIDAFYSAENSIQTLFGSIGECITKNDDGSYVILAPADATIDPGTWKWTNALADKGPMYIPDDMQVTLPADLQAISELEKAYDDVVANIDLENDVWPRAFINFSEEDNMNLGLVGVDVSNIVSINFSKWVTEGVKDGEWETSVENLKTAGIETSIDIMQKAYDEFKSK